jgi:hypothetical protein
MLDDNEQQLMIHIHKQFEHDQMYTKKDFINKELKIQIYTCANSTELGS